MYEHSSGDWSSAEGLLRTQISSKPATNGSRHNFIIVFRDRDEASAVKRLF